MAGLVYDYVIIGSGFGGSVCALRLAEKGYTVLVLEKGRRFEDVDLPRRNWRFWDFLWLPVVRAYGILQISILQGVMVLHGAGVGGGSLGYANVLEIPNAQTFATPAWNQPIPWGEVLTPHFAAARRMLGAVTNPRLWAADHHLQAIAAELGQVHTFRSTEVGVYFGEEGITAPDPYFSGAGPARTGCVHCGGCMVGCRFNAKNTLPKNYLYLAEKLGVVVRAETEAVDVRPLQGGLDGARYEVHVRRSTGFWPAKPHPVRAAHVIFAGGVMNTIRLLLNLRERPQSLPLLSSLLGSRVRTNSEALLGAVARRGDVDYSKGISITSIVDVDAVTRVEPVRYPDGSSLMRFISAPLVDLDAGWLRRLWCTLAWIARHPLDFSRAMVLPGWAHNTTILLVMQNLDNRMRFQLGRSFWTLGRRSLVAREEPGYEIRAQVKGSHALVRSFSRRTNSVPMGTLGENLLNLPTTAHILGGAPVGRTAQEGVVNERFEVHHYPGLMIVDGSIMPANPGVNPSLTITALAEYAMSLVPDKTGSVRQQTPYP